MVIPHTAVAGETGELQLSAPKGYPAHIPINLYHGFREDDPFLALEQEYMIELQVPLEAGAPILLGWEVLPNRNIDYWWRSPEGNPQVLVERFGRSKGKQEHKSLLSQQQALLDQITIE
jgi:hypothetical protein